MKTKIIKELQEIEQLQCLGCPQNGEVQKLIQKLSVNEDDHDDQHTSVKKEKQT